MATTKEITFCSHNCALKYNHSFDHAEGIKTGIHTIEFQPVTDFSITYSHPSHIKRKLEVDGEIQMDSLEGIATSLISGATGLPPSLVGIGTGFVGSILQKKMNLPSNQDSPGIVNTTPTDFSLCDIPRETGHLGFKKVHHALDAKNIVQQASHRSMSLTQRCKVPSLLTTFQWTASCSNSPFLLGYVSCSPQALFGVERSGGFIYRTETNLSYASNLFKYWRGELEFEIEIIANQFHAGQLFVAFNPNNDAAEPIVTNAGGLLSQTIEICSSTTTFVVPYVTTSDYLTCRADNGAQAIAPPGLDLQPWNSNPIDASLGRLYVYVQSMLQAPPTAPQTVYVNIWIKAGRNFQFSVPYTRVCQVAVDGVYQSDDPPTESASGNPNTQPTDHATAEEGEHEFLEEDQDETGDNADQLTDENPIKEVLPVETADTCNIVGRRYLTRVNIVWDTTLVQGHAIFNALFPGEIFTKTELAFRGILNYHEFYRGGFEIHLKFNSQLQYLGLAILAFIPLYGVRDFTEILPTLRNLPHVKFNPSVSATASLHVPYSAISRVVRSRGFDFTLGEVALIVINPLLVPPESCNKLMGAMHVQVRNAHFAVKRLLTATSRYDSAAAHPSQKNEVEGVYQMLKAGDKAKPTADQRKGTTVPVRVWGEKNMPRQQGSFIADHSNIYDLMKRPYFISTRPIATGTNDLAFNMNDNPNHAYIGSLFAFWNGGFRLHLTSDVGSADPILVTATADFANFNSIPTPVVQRSFQGWQAWKPGVEPAKAFYLPYYAIYGLLNCRGELTHTPDTLQGSIRLQCLNTNADPPIRRNLYVSVSVADDFNYYFPLPCPQTRIPPPATDVVDGWQRDLTQEGIEPNPGPGVITHWIAKQLKDILSSAASQSEEGIKRKVAEVYAAIKKQMMVDTVHDLILPILSAVLDIALHIRLIFIDTSCMARVAAFTAIALRIYNSLHDAYRVVDSLRLSFEHWLDIEIPETEVRDAVKPEAQNYPPNFVYANRNEVDGEMQAIMGLPAAIATSCLAAMVGALGYTVSSETQDSIKKAADGKFVQMCTKLGKISSGARGAKDIWLMLKAGTETAFDYLFNPHPHEDWFKENWDKMNELFQWYAKMKCANAFSTPLVGKLINGVYPGKHLLTYRELVSNALIHFPYIKEVSLDHKLALKEIVATMAYVTGDEHAAEPRHEPVGIYIAGSAGCGKSVFAKEALSVPILMLTGNIGADWKRQIYAVPRSDDQQYFDGYHAQPIAIIDDFGQGTDDKDFKTVIDLITSVQTPLPMAHLEQKSATFTSRIVIATSNLSSFGAVTSIKDREAAARRFPIAVYVTLKKSVQGKLDYGAFQNDVTKCIDLDSYCQLVDSYYEIKVLNLLIGVRRETITFKTMLKNIVEQYRKRSAACPVGDALMGMASFSFSDDVDEIQGQEQMMRSDNEMQPLLVPSAFQMPSVVPTFKHVDITRQGGALGIKGAYKDSEQGVYVVGVDHNTDKPWYENLGDPNAKGIFKGLQCLVGLGIYAAVGYGIFILLRFLFRAFISEKIVEGDEQAKYSNDKGKTLRKPTVRGRLQNTDEKVDKVLRNLVRVRTANGATFGIALDNKHILTNWHVMDGVNEMEVQFKNRGGELDRSIFTNVEGCMQRLHHKGQPVDAVLIQLATANVDHVKTVWHLFTSMADFNKITVNRALGLNNYEGTVESKLVVFKGCDSLLFHGEETRVGDCGYPYALLRGAQAPVFGIHTGLSRDKACILAPITIDALNKAKNAFPRQVVSVGDYQFDDFQCVETEGNEFDEDKMEFLGKMTVNGHELNNYFAMPSVLVRSPIQPEEFDDGFLPSRKNLVPETGVHPMYTNAQKYFLREHESPSKLAFDESVIEYCKDIPASVGRALTEHEMLNGFGSMNRIVLTTSPGYISRWVSKEDLIDALPGKVINGIKEKDVFVFSQKAKEFEIPLYKKTFYQNMIDEEERCVQAIRPTFLWTSTLKDELRPIAKVKAGKTRVFENPDFGFSLLFRKYFGHFITWFKEKRGFRLHHAIGIDREQASKQIYEDLEWKENCFDEDYTNFDGSIPQFLFEFFLRITDHYYGDFNQKARHALVACLRNSLLIVGPYLYESSQGNKSGNPATDVFNSVVNAGLHYIIYHTIFGEVTDFRDNVAMLTYGDDVVGSVSPYVADSFNRVSIAYHANKFGMTMTPASKDGEMVPLSPIEEVTFLKSSFGKEGEVITFPLPTNVIEKELRWEKKANVGNELLLKQRIRCGLEMASHHPKEYYDWVRKKIVDCGFGNFIDHSRDYQLQVVYSKQQVPDLQPRQKKLIRLQTHDEVDGEYQMHRNKSSRRANSLFALGQYRCYGETEYGLSPEMEIVFTPRLESLMSFYIKPGMLLGNVKPNPKPLRENEPEGEMSLAEEYHYDWNKCECGLFHIIQARVGRMEGHSLLLERVPGGGQRAEPYHWNAYELQRTRYLCAHRVHSTVESGVMIPCKPECNSSRCKHSTFELEETTDIYLHSACRMYIGPSCNCRTANRIQKKVWKMEEFAMGCKFENFPIIHKDFNTFVANFQMVRIFGCNPHDFPWLHRQKWATNFLEERGILLRVNDGNMEYGLLGKGLLPEWYKDRMVMVYDPHAFIACRVYPQQVKNVRDAIIMAMERNALQPSGFHLMEDVRAVRESDGAYNLRFDDHWELAGNYQGLRYQDYTLHQEGNPIVRLNDASEERQAHFESALRNRERDGSFVTGLDAADYYWIQQDLIINRNNLRQAAREIGAEELPRLRREDRTIQSNSGTAILSQEMMSEWRNEALYEQAAHQHSNADLPRAQRGLQRDGILDFLPGFRAMMDHVIQLELESDIDPVGDPLMEWVRAQPPPRADHDELIGGYLSEGLDADLIRFIEPIEDGDNIIVDPQYSLRRNQPTADQTAEADRHRLETNDDLYWSVRNGALL